MGNVATIENPLQHIAYIGILQRKVGRRIPTEESYRRSVELRSRRIRTRGPTRGIGYPQKGATGGLPVTG